MLLARALLVTLAIGIPLAPVTADAQQPAKVARIGLLWFTPLSATGHLVEAFRRGLRKLGYVEGQNIAIEFRSAEGKLERVPELAAELVRLKVDVILTGTTPLIRAAQQETKTIPIVMGVSVDPVKEGFVASLAHPGGNITGLTLVVGPEIGGKLLELLKEAVPQVSRIAVLWHAYDPSAAPLFREIEVAARAFGVQLQFLEVRGPNELERAFQAAIQGRAGGLIVLQVAPLFQHRTRIADLAAKSRLPSVSDLREYAEAGGLMTYGANISDMLRRAATYVDKILKGAKPADLPVEQPTKFELVINLKTAKALGLTIPQSVLFRADKVIE